jgi:hypothetical protein
MARLKRSSSGLEQAIRRLAGMRSISETLEFGDGLSLVEYDARIEALQTQLSSYNTMLSTLDEITGQIELMEQELRSYSEKMLMSVAARYGKDSLQYMQAGGKQRKHHNSRSSTTPTTLSATSTSLVAASGTEKAKTNGKETAVSLSS